VITDPGEETSPDLPAEGRAETGVMDFLADMSAPPVQHNGELAPDVGCALGAAAPYARRAVAEARAETGALQTATAPRDKMGIEFG